MKPIEKIESTVSSAKARILLILPPFWPPQIPPVGITSLKNHLEPKGYSVRAVDANIEAPFRDVYTSYFRKIEEFVPEHRQGNLYGIGTDVLKNHFMAHLNKSDEGKYIELVKTIVAKTYYVDLDDGQALTLIRIAEDFFQIFKGYILDLIKETRPSVFGISMFSGNAPAALFAFKLAREHYPSMLNVMGGGIFADHLAPDSPNMEFFLEKTRDIIDKIIIGEGEILFLKLLEGELPASKQVFDARDIDGELLDLSQAELLDFSDLDLSHYPYSTGYTSRSCPFQCAFCSETVMWGRYRRKPAVQTVRELEQLFERDKKQIYSFCDSLLNPIIDELSREFIKSRYAIYWDACLRADKEAMHADKAIMWRRGGFYKAWLGLESGSQRMLDLMNKKITVSQTRKVLANLAQAGIKTATLWIIGHPGETEEDFQQTLDLIEECKDDIYDAEGTPFWYFPKGQSNSGKWAQGKAMQLYPADAKDMLILQTWILDGVTPSREETYDRLNRFMAHLKRLGIPNPYTLFEMFQADERWRSLHANAVPSIVEFDSTTYVDECKSVDWPVYMEGLPEE